MAPPASDPAGVIAVDKPAGWTSHDVVAVARRAAGVKRVGHGGTLDPRATGLLPVLIGPATRWVARLHEAPKVYAAAIRFGSETTTDDAEGEVTRAAAAPEIELDALDHALERFRGEIAQVPPQRSAVKVAGVRAYTRSRAGEDVALKARHVRVDRISIASWRSPVLRLVIVCGSGTYIRSLARDVGRALGSAAHLAALRRLAVGALDAGDALTTEELRSMGPDGVRARLRPTDDRLLSLPDRYMAEPAERLLEGWETT